MPDYTNEELAQDLADIGGRDGITPYAHEVWRLQRGYDRLLDADGQPEQGFAMCRKYGVGTRTLQRWAREVDMKLLLYRLKLKEGVVRYGCSIASGSRVRWAADKTAAGQGMGSSWNEERIAAALKGTSRKQGKLPPSKKKPAA